MTTNAESLVLVLGTAEWDATIATNQHYAARELAQAFDVLFVESLGLRRPTLQRQDLARIKGRLTRRRGRSARLSTRARPSRLSLSSPLVIPVHTRLTRRLNSFGLERAVDRWLQHEGPRVLWTYTPVTYGLQQLADATVYHLVDLLHEYPRVDRRAVLSNEKILSHSATAAIASSEAVATHLRRSGFSRVELMPNVADVEPFLAASANVIRSGDCPVVLFAGNITPNKIDLDYLEALHRRLAGTARVKLIGPVGLGGGASTDWLARLNSIGVEIAPPMTIEQLASEYASAAVGIIPYALNDYTRGVNPLKTYEYLAAGLPVVSTRVPAVEAKSGAVWVESTPEDFAVSVGSLLDRDHQELRTMRQGIARQHGWSERGTQLRELVTDSLQASASGWRHAS